MDGQTGQDQYKVLTQQIAALVGEAEALETEAKTATAGRKGEIADRLDEITVEVTEIEAQRNDLVAEEAAEREHAARAQQEAREHGAINRKPALRKATGHPNDGTVIVDETAGALMVDLSALKMVKGSTGKISGYGRILINGKAIGAVTIYAPADLDTAEASQDREAKRLREIALDKFRSGDVDAGQRYLADADAAQKRYQDARDRAKRGWENSTALEVVKHMSLPAEARPITGGNAQPDGGTTE